MTALKVPTSNITWEKCWRIIPSRYPTINVFERISSPEDFHILYELEGLTNDRLREETGNLSLVAPEDRVFGPGTSYIMSAFTHLSPEGSRFTDGTWGVYYAANDLDTAISETKYHREAFMRATNEPPLHLDMRVLVAKLTGTIHDLRGNDFRNTDIYNPSTYETSQALANQLKEENSGGVVYWSVRHPGGQNAGIFRPKRLSNCTQERHLEYAWDGQRITAVFEKKQRAG